MKKGVQLTIQEVENRNIPTFLSESALAATNCSTTTCTTSSCLLSPHDDNTIIQEI